MSTTINMITLEVEMPWEPNLTDNHRTGQNGFRKYLKPNVKQWQHGLGILVRNQAGLAGMRLADDQRFVIKVSYTFPRKAIADASNLHKSISDGIKGGLGVDDRYFFFQDDPDVKIVEDARDAGFVIRIIPLEPK